MYCVKGGGGKGRKNNDCKMNRRSSSCSSHNDDTNTRASDRKKWGGGRRKATTTTTTTTTTTNRPGAPSTLCSSGAAFNNKSASSSSSSSCSSSCSSSSSPLPYLFRLITHQQWKNIRTCLKSPKKAAVLCQERDKTNLSCLSLALGHRAPLDIIERMIEIDPSLPKACDDYGANALHVGCLNGAPLESLDLIVRKYNELITTLDTDLRSPLHHAVELVCAKISSSYESCTDLARSSYSSQEGGEHRPLMDKKVAKQVEDLTYCTNLLRMLCKSSPEMVYAQDRCGSTPIDLIQLNKADLDSCSKQYEKLDVAYTVLKSTGVELYRRKKKMWEAESARLRLLDKSQGSEKQQSPGSRYSEELSSKSSASRSTFSSQGRSTVSFEMVLSKLDEEENHNGGRKEENACMNLFRLGEFDDLVAGDNQDTDYNMNIGQVKPSSFLDNLARKEKQERDSKGFMTELELEDMYNELKLGDEVLDKRRAKNNNVAEKEKLRNSMSKRLKRTEITNDSFNEYEDRSC